MEQVSTWWQLEKSTLMSQNWVSKSSKMGTKDFWNWELVIADLLVDFYVNKVNSKVGYYRPDSSCEFKAKES